ncbi:hypothetical protein [Antribacter gilvus]|uniref:hypothetical protein n=1 Tax=Antribacter gilvus TaxID=2304675 RepID=UPI000F770BD5|nr:hypothetical protein [Antribacter gilvus]
MNAEPRHSRLTRLGPGAARRVVTTLIALLCAGLLVPLLASGAQTPGRPGLDGPLPFGAQPSGSTSASSSPSGSASASASPSPSPTASSEGAGAGGGAGADAGAPAAVVPRQPAPAGPVVPPSTSGPGWTVDASTVGLRPHGLSCDALPVYTGSWQVPRGTVISGMRITEAIDLSAGGITIERSCVRPGEVSAGNPVITTKSNITGGIAPERVVIRDSDIDGSLLDTESAAMVVAFMGVADLVGNYVHGFGSGIAVMNAGEKHDMRVERNYVTGHVAWGDAAGSGNHSDAFTIRDFSAASRSDRSLVVRNNRFDCDSGNATGAFFIQTYAGRIDNVHIEGNLLEGEGWQLVLHEMTYPYSGMVALNNRLTGTGWGDTYVATGPGWARWQDNYRFGPGAADARGTAIGQPRP